MSTSESVALKGARPYAFDSRTTLSASLSKQNLAWSLELPRDRTDLPHPIVSRRIDALIGRAVVATLLLASLATASLVLPIAIDPLPVLAVTVPLAIATLWWTLSPLWSADFDEAP